ncbi:disease resistance protein RGA4-like [Panicum virgatum]|uniref:Uncharacterized protein n=1 Tax=Panicum virgatum TaxID=38727 RepID=A0A8T0V5I8_PANVG|nr:disease resistance protein RGA4-like [Panicum virgatum]KAG2629788.1 hypothetical protein PVAP13_3KG450300 [Panicum virgatum]
MELAAIVVPPLLTAAMNTLLPKMLVLVEKRSRLSHDVQRDIYSLMRELDIMWGTVRDYSKSAQRKDSKDLKEAWIKQVSELANKIEDCVDNYIYDQTAHRNEVPNLDHFSKQIKELKKESDELSINRGKYKDDDAGYPNQEIPASSGTSSPSRCCPPVLLDLVGTGSPLRELLDLVEEEQAEGQSKKLKVISIHGLDGLGKTAIAAQVYGHKDVLKQFGNNRAWVDAAGKDARQVLQEILQHCPFPQLLQAQPRDTFNAEQLCEHLRAHLQNKRYFIVIDDMRKFLWSTIKRAFPENDGYSSRVVVTTSFHQIAKDCCSTTRDYVYIMQGLNANFSQELFFKSANIEEPSHDLKKGSEELRTKCSGLPLALVSVAEFLKARKDGLTLTGRTCNDVCRRLGYHLERASSDHTALERMQEVLIRSYNCLPGNTAKASLVCVGMFPSGHPIKRTRLIRRWMAEGLFEKTPNPQDKEIDKAAENFKTLIDWNVVQPNPVSNSDEVRSCQPPGMMLEFIRHRFMSGTTLFYEKKLPGVPQGARRLSLHHCTAENVQQQAYNLSLVRSLTIFGKVCKGIMNFDKYRLLRVLDLEECNNDLTNDHLKGICKLFLLNYLSLGRTVTQLPRDMKRLEYLETLDVRRANLEVSIPFEVIMLPRLTYLFGKFKLLDNVSKKIPDFFKEGKSKLEILAGFVIADRNDSFLQLIAHMNNLRKVKIWCKSSADSSNLANLSSAVQRYIEDKDNNYTNSDRSLSLDSDVSFPQFNPEGDLQISSLKLRGDLFEVPHFVASLFNLGELCLSSTTTLRGSLLTVLTELTCLVYLKLVATEVVDFVITDETKFPSLNRLCFEVQRSPFLKIEGNPLPQLASFQLLCDDAENLPLINIESIGRLREVTLYCIENKDSRKTWEDAAKRHPNRPRVFFVVKESGLTEASVATDHPSPQKKKWWKVLTTMFRPNKFKERTRPSAIGGTNNGRPGSMPLTEEATGEQAETSGSTAGPNVTCPAGEQAETSGSTAGPNVTCPSGVHAETSGSTACDSISGR